MLATKNNYRLGLVSVSFRPYSPKEIIDATVAAGLSCIEWGSDVHAPCKDKERLLVIKELQDKAGISCSSYGTYFRLGETPIDELCDYIDAAKLLGTDILRLWCGNKRGDECSEQEREALLADCKRAAQLAEQAGVTLCMECHKKSFTERVEDTLWLMREVNSPAFRMYWQPFQWKSVADDVDYAKKVAQYAEHLHVFNWEGEGRFPLCEAIDEWKSYLSCFSGERTLLLEFMPDDKIESLKTEADALRAIVEE